MRFLLLLLGSFCSFQVSAEVYKCVVSGGDTVYQSSPCLAGASKTEINTKTGVSTDLNAIENKQVLDEKALQEKLAKEQAEKEAIEKRKAQLIQDTLSEIEKNKQLIRDHPQQFSAFAIPPYIPDKLNPLVETFRERLPEIERLRRYAAEKALASQQCGRVEADELSVKSTKTALSFLVDCSSGKSFLYTEKELAK